MHGDVVKPKPVEEDSGQQFNDACKRNKQFAPVRKSSLSHTANGFGTSLTGILVL